MQDQKSDITGKIAGHQEEVRGQEQSVADGVTVLRREHRDLDRQIQDLEKAPGRDDLEIRQLKVRKLAIRDQLAAVRAI